MGSDDSRSTLQTGPCRLLRVEAMGESDVLRSILLAAAQNGFEGVDVHVANDGSMRSEAVATIPTRLAGLCEEMGLPAMALTAPCPGLDASQAAVEVCRLLHVARSTGVSFLNLLVQLPIDSERYGGQVGGQALVNFLHRLLQLVTLDVEASGAVLALTMPNGRSILSAVELRELIDGAHSWAVGACVDAGCVGQQGALTDWILTLGRRVFTMRLDALVGSPGTEELRRSLQTITFEGALISASVETMGTMEQVCPQPY